MRDASMELVLRQLRNQGKDDAHYEVKTCSHDLSKDVWESVSAFANTGGGVLILGVSEKDGFTPVPDFAIDRVCDQLVSGMGDGGGEGRLTSPPHYTIERERVAGMDVLVIAIDELGPSQKPCYITAQGVLGGSYKRVDDKDIKLSANEVYLLQSAMTVDPSDRLPVRGASLDDLDSATYEQVFAKARLVMPRAVRGAQTTGDYLKRLNLIDGDGRVMRAGLLVAGVYPQQFFPKIHIDVAVHPGSSKSSDGSVRFTDRAICEGTLGEMVEDAVSAVVKNLRRTSVVRGIGRTDELEIPEEMLREAMANAVIHRSYDPRFDGEAVAVDVFDDRVEVINPGGLWGKSRDELADGRSCCRNATIMRLMFLAPLPVGAVSPVEGNGSGIPFMLREARARGLRAPEFIPTADYFKVILWRPGETKRRESALSGARALEEILRENGETSLRELVERSGMSTSQVRRRVNELIEAGAVEATAPVTSRNRKYRAVG